MENTTTDNPQSQEEINPNIQRVIFPKLPVKKVVSYHSGTILANEEPQIEITEEKDMEVKNAYHQISQSDSLSLDQIHGVFTQLGFCKDQTLFQPIIDKKLLQMKFQKLLAEDATALTEDQFLHLFKFVYAPAYYYGQRLRMYVGRSEFAEAKELMLRQCQVNSANGEGLTPLHYACEYNRVEMVELLHTTCRQLSQALLVSAQDKYGWTPLHCAAHHGSLACIKKLFEFFPSEEMEKCLHMKNNVGKSALHLACAQNRSDIVKLLLSSGANLNDQDNRGMTPLHEASYRGRNALFQELYHDERVNRELRDDLGRLAIDYIEEDRPTSPWDK